jgi:hypothetical protein
VAFVSRKSKGKTETPAPKASGRAQSLALFGPPPLIEGEDLSAYEHLRARICATVKPVDIIYEILINDVVSYQWEISRERRLKSSLLQARGLEALERFVAKQLDNYFKLYMKQLRDRLVEILQDLLEKNRADFARTLANQCVYQEVDAMNEVNKILVGVGLDLNRVMDDVRDCRAKELVQQFVRREPFATKMIDFFLTKAGVSMDTFMAEGLVRSLDDIERIDRRISIAEDRRNATLREIDRHQAALGETLRRSGKRSGRRVPWGRRVQRDRNDASQETA